MNDVHTRETMPPSADFENQLEYFQRPKTIPAPPPVPKIDPKPVPKLELKLDPIEVDVEDIFDRLEAPEGVEDIDVDLCWG